MQWKNRAAAVAAPGLKNQGKQELSGKAMVITALPEALWLPIYAAGA